MQDRFTIYDVFAVLVPGVVFIYLLAFTLDRAVGIQIFDWTGSIGDATLLLIFGYAAGTLLQAVGNVLVERTWLGIRGGQPTATMLMSGSKKLSASFKSEVLAALATMYGQPSLGEKDDGYRDMLEERTYRAWKVIVPEDAQAQRCSWPTRTWRSRSMTPWSEKPLRREAALRHATETVRSSP